MKLTPRENQIVELLSRDVPAKEIAPVLGVSIHTVRNHTRRLFAKLQVHTAAGAVGVVFRKVR